MYKKISKIKDLLVVTSLLAFSRSSVWAQSSDDIGDTAEKFTGYFDSFENLLIGLAGIGGLLLMIFGLFEISRKDGAGGQNNKTGGWIKVIVGGALAAIITIRAILTNSV